MECKIKDCHNVSTQQLTFRFSSKKLSCVICDECVTDLDKSDLHEFEIKPLLQITN